MTELATEERSPGSAQGSPEPLVEEVAVEALNRKAKGSAEKGLSLYADRVKIHPRRVKGLYRSLKWAIMVFCLGVYYVTPWLRWDRGANVPDQAVLIDLPARRFYFFFIEIWAQEVYYLTGLLILAGLALFLFTTLFGRVWCGYACPQTVWTDLFLWVERFIEGDRNSRIKLDRAQWSGEKIRKRIIKHSLWVLISVATGGAWVFYFADAPTLASDLIRLDAPSVAYLFIALFTGTTYLLGGLAREQVCIYMCPWPRIQSAMLDEESLLVSYRPWRGEPRGKHKKGSSWENRGHCVDCKQCVVVCPMGIDIRDGLQLECIHCALCIDACNSVMAKLDLPLGLIGYDTPQSLAQKKPQGWPRILRARPVLYIVLILLVSAVMLITLINRSDLQLSVLRDRNPLYVVLSDGSLRNGYTLKVINKAIQARQVTLRVEGLAGAKLSSFGHGEEGEALILDLPPDHLTHLKVYLRLPTNSLEKVSVPVSFVLEEMPMAPEAPVLVETTTTFRGPEND